MPVTSLTRYAKHRGISPTEISKACKEGKLRESVTRDAYGRVCAIDWEIADREWAERSDYTDAPQRVQTPQGPPVDWEDEAPAPGVPAVRPGMSLGEASAAERFWKAQQAELTFKEKAKELVPASEIEREWIDMLTSIRTKLLGIPSRMRQQDPTLTAPQVGMVEALIREALENLADEL